MSDTPAELPATSFAVSGAWETPAPTLTVTPDVIREDGRNRVVRTGAQAGGGVGAVVLIRYLFVRYLPSQLPPDDVLLVAVGIVTTLWARWANRHRINGHV